MKYKYIILILIFVCSIVTACSKLLQADTAPQTIVVTETVVVEDTAKIAELQEKLLETSKRELAYKNLIANLNELLSCVYYGYASNKYVLGEFTAFSLEYNGKYYLITAGHCVENEHGKLDNFKFKANFSNEWIYPKLLKYESDFEHQNDYAIFYSDKVNKGLKYNLENTFPKYILGKDNTIEEYNVMKLKDGDSGSPIININGEVIEIATGYYADIELVINGLN